MPSSSPNILILSAYDVGGASIAAIRQHLGFLRAGFSSKFMSLHRTSGNIPHHEQFSPRTDWKSRFSLKIKQRQEHKLRSGLIVPLEHSLSGEFSMPLAPYDVTESPLWAWADVVILHWVNEWIRLETLVEKAGQKPMIWVMHDMHAFSGGCHYNHGCEGLTLQCRGCPLLAETNQPELANGFWTSKKKALDQFKPRLTITAPSQWMANWSQGSSLFGKLKHEAIFNSLDTTIFRPISGSVCREVLGLPQDKKILLCVVQSLSDRRKGFQYLIDAIKILPDPESWILCTVGKLHTQNLNLPVVHQHLGTLVDERLMAMVYNAANIFVHPAIEDNLPNVVVEALACGIPVAGFAIGGMPEMVKNGENGFLASDIQSEWLMEAILKTNEANFDKVLIAKEAASRFALSVQAANFRNLIDRILQ